MAKERDSREKIVNALWCCTHSGNCMKCGYNHRGSGDCLHRLLVDAHELLKAQEPRLLTAKDFESNPMLDDDGRLPCWCEDMVDGDGWTAVSVGGVLPDHVKANGCRYWTSRPTKDQREATPWPRD